MIPKRHFYEIVPFELFALSPAILAPQFQPPKDIQSIDVKDWEFVGWDTQSPVCRIDDDYAAEMNIPGDHSGPTSFYKVSIVIPGANTIPGQPESGLIIFDHVQVYGGLKSDKVPFCFGGDIIFRGALAVGRLPNGMITYVDYRTTPSHPNAIINVSGLN